MNKRGLTLIEIIISVLIIVIMAAGIFGAFIGGHQLMERSRHRLQALNFAKEALDRLRSNYQYTNPAIDPDPMSECAESDLTKSEAYCHDESEIVGGEDLIVGEMQEKNSAELKYNVFSPPESGPDSYKRVTVKIVWDEVTF